MQIALLSWESLHSIRVGGLSAHVSELAAALTVRGHDVHLFTRLDAGQRHYDQIDGVHYHRCVAPGRHDLIAYAHAMCDSFLERLRLTERFFDRPFDVVHAHDWLTVPALVHCKNELGRRVVFTFHSTEHGRCGNHAGWDAIHHLEWEAGYVAERIVCVSRALRDEVHWLYQVPVDKMHVVYNGVDVERFDIRVNTRRVRAACGIDPNDPIVLFAGRLAWQKGPDVLLDAAPHVLRQDPDTKFIFAGDGDLRSSLESRLASSPIGGACRMLGYRSGRELVQLFKTADTVCVPSRNEPFGIVILEAWSASKPVVATRNGGPAEFVSHGETGLTVALNEREIGEGLTATLADRENARRMGANGRTEAESKYAWSVIAGQTEAVYAQLL
jgi:glycosyltransferase involved in cell wall biosynthesis